MRRRSFSVIAFATALRLRDAGAGAHGLPLKSRENERGAVKLLLDIASRRLIAAEGMNLARRWVVPPGSAIKPFTLLALVANGGLRPNDSIDCPGTLRIGDRSLNCSHPRLGYPVDTARAIAYSCNCFVAHFAARFRDGELARILSEYGFGSPSGLAGTEEAAGTVIPASGEDQREIQALGEYGVAITPLGLLDAYRRLAIDVQKSKNSAILEGLEGAVEYGTAQLAGVKSVKVAGKTGSARAASGANIAWFAGFAPSRAPRVAVAVLTQGRSGGGDAAPLAHKMIEAHMAECL